MRKLARLLVIVCTMAGSLLVAVQPAFAGTQEAGVCTSTMNRWLGYENEIGDTRDNDDRLWLCNVGSLGGDNLDIDHALSGTCAATVHVADDWANCMGSLYPVIVDASRALCVYDGWGFSGNRQKLSIQSGWVESDGTGPRRNFRTWVGFGQDDVASFKWISYNGSC